MAEFRIAAPGEAPEFKPLLQGRNYPAVDPSLTGDAVIQTPRDNNFPLGYARPLPPVQLTAANLRSGTIVIDIARPSLVKVTGMAGMAIGPGLAAAVDAPTLTLTARGGSGPNGPVPDQFYLAPNDRAIRANRGLLYLPHAGQWALSYKGSGEVVAANTWTVFATLYEGVPAPLYQGIVGGPPTVMVSYVQALGAGESALIVLGGGFGVNDISFRSIRLAASAAGCTYSIGGTVGVMPISTSTTATDIPSDLLGMGFVRLNSAGAANIFVYATLDP